MRFLLSMLMLLSSVGLFAQYKISGRVVSPEKESLLGASVVIEGTSIGTVTDKNGEFVLEGFKKNSYQIKFSFIGYQSVTKNVTIEKDLFLQIELPKDVVLTEEVFVYSTRAGQKTPVATTEITKAEIKARNLGQDVPYLLSSSPSFVSTSDAGAGVGYTGFRIRGTDATRINVTINGIPFNEAESHDVYWVDLPDFSSSVENIQIQRGVGTSTQGAAAFGATINMQTNALRKDAYAEYNGAAGSFNTLKNTVSVGTGLIKNHYSFDARLSKITSDGFIDRATSNLKSFFISGGYYADNSILKLNIFSGKEVTYQAWNGVPSVRLNNDIEGMKRYEDHWLYSSKQTAEMLASDSRTYNLYTYENQVDDYQQDHYQLLFNQKFGENFNLNSALHYTKGKGFYEQYNEDDKFKKYGLPNVITEHDTIKSTNLIRQKWLDNDFFGGTFSLNYLNNKSDFTLGAGWNKYLGNHFGEIIWAEYSGTAEKGHEWYRNKGIKTDFNVYAKYNYAFTDFLNLYADIQYRNILHSIEGTDDDLRDIAQDHNFDFVNPKLGIFYQPTESSKAYLSWAVGHREPSRSNFTDADPAGSLPTFETLNDFEGGYSYTSPKLSVGANLYFMSYNNQLILTGEINDVGSAIMTNVKDSYRAGIEIIAGVKVLPNLTWDINATFSQNKILNFTEYVDSWDNGGQESFELGTTDIAFAPTIVANSTICYEPISDLKLSLMSQYIGDQFIDNSSNEGRKLDAYLVNNIKISYSVKQILVDEIQINLLVNNILNEEYETNAWIYSYIYDGQRWAMDGYFPQAGTNFLLGIDIRF
jgi:iron complex outermembrane receptor protein